MVIYSLPRAARQRSKPTKLAPRFFAQPARIRVVGRQRAHGHATCQQKPELGRLKLRQSFLDTYGQQKSKKELVLFEKRSRHVEEEEVGEVVVEEVQTGVEIVGRFGICDCAVEERDIPREGVPGGGLMQ